MDKIELLKKLISIDTTNSKNGPEVKKVVEKYLGKKATTIKIKEVENYLFFKGKGKQLFILCGHYDVVPAKGWDAFKPKIKKGFLYGRGSGDMKSGLVSLIETFKNAPNNLPFSLCLALVGDEEKGGSKGGLQIAKHLDKRFKLWRYLGAEDVSGEAFSKVIIGRKGVLRLKILLEGQGGHGAYPENAQTPIFDLPKILEKINKIKFPKSKMGKTTMSVTSVSAISEAPNVFAKEAEIVLDIRYTDVTTEKQILEVLKRILKKTAKSKSKIIKIKRPESKPYYNSKKGLKQIAQKAVEKIVKKKPVSAVANGGSDARFFAYKGCECVEIGPQAFNIHAKDEKVRLEDLEKLCKIFEEIMDETIKKY